MSEIPWIEELLEDIPQLLSESRLRPYYSQRAQPAAETPPAEVATVVRRVRAVVDDFDREHWFAKTLGYECVDQHGASPRTLVDVLDAEVGKGHLLKARDPWSEDDLYDYIEVMHDLSARPTTGWVHTYMGCGFHPSAYDRRSGQRLFRWRMNQVLANSGLGVELAEDGEDVGRIVHMGPAGVDALTVVVLSETPRDHRADVRHAIATFRARGSGVAEKRAAIVALAGVLELRRSLIDDNLLSKDEGALFEIANKYDLRHRRADQKTDYDEVFLDWIFYWYLGTINLTNQLLVRQNA